MKYSTAFVLIFSFCSIAKGQNNERTFYGGVMYKNSGIGMVYQDKVDLVKGFDKQIDIEFTTFRHSQEAKTFNSEVNNPTPFVFGKLNKAALLKMQYSLRHNVSQFSDAQRIGIDIGFGGGIIIGFLKPVYLNLIYPDPLGYETLVSEKYNPLKHTDKERIAGYTDGRVGWSEIDYQAGITISASMGFTWGYFTNYPKRLETGLFLEYFKNGLPVMALVQNNPLQQGVFIKMLFGKTAAKN